MNIQALMKQAQKAQAEMEKKQKALEAEIFTAKNGEVTIEMTGAKQITSVTISEDILEAENKEMLQDMVMLAVNEVLSTISEKEQAVMSDATGNLKVPGMF